MKGAASGTEANGRFRTDSVSRIIYVLVGVVGATPASGQSWRVIPSISVSETYTDNVNLAPAANKRSDLITQISPGIRLNQTTGRVKLDVNYRMSGLLYARSADQHQIQNYLDAIGSWEAVSNRVFVDANAFISQQPVSAFGAQPQPGGTNENVNNNRAETLTYRLSPYVQGRFGSTADYQFRFTEAGTTTRGNQLSDTQVQEWLGTLRSLSAPAGLGWGVDASHQIVSSQVQRSIDTTRLTGSLIYKFDPQLRATGLIGYESNNYSITESQSAATYGGRIEWLPTDRTVASAYIERRPFGNAHEFSFRHRSQLSGWQFTDSKTVTTLANQLATPQTTAFNVLSAALTSQFPDPAERAREVERRLQQTGTPRDLALSAPFLTTRVLLQHARQASVSLSGARNAVTLGAALVDSSPVDTGVSALDDFARSSEIRQRSFTGSWSHTLTGYSTLTLLVSQIRSTGSQSGADSKQSFANLLFSHQLGPRTFASIGTRYDRFDGSGQPSFREKAVTASLSVSF